MKNAIQHGDLVEVYNEGSGSYEWEDYYLYYHIPSRRYFADEQGGCSCNYYEPPYGNELEGYVTWSREEALRNTTGDANRALRDFKESEYVK